MQDNKKAILSNTENKKTNRIILRLIKFVCIFSAVALFIGSFIGLIRGTGSIALSGFLIILGFGFLFVPHAIPRVLNLEDN